MITYVKPSTIELTRGNVITHDATIIALIKEKPRTFADLFQALDVDKSWLGTSKQTVKSVLSGRLTEMRKNGAIVDASVPKSVLMENIETLRAVAEEKRAEVKAARIVAKKAVAAENYKKRKAAALEMEEKIKFLESSIVSTEKLVSDAEDRVLELKNDLVEANDTIEMLKQENSMLSYSYRSLSTVQILAFLLFASYYLYSNPAVYEPLMTYILDL